MKHLKLFETEAEYNAYKNGDNFVTPNVSYAEDSTKVYYSPHEEETRLTICYDVQDISSPTSLCSNYDFSIIGMEVDGIKLDSIVIEYQFDTVGDHIVKYEFTNPTLIGSTVDNPTGQTGAPLFMNSATMKYIIIPSSITAIGFNSFNRSGLSGDLVIPDYITQIGQAAFLGTKITSIKLSNNLTKLSGGILSDCPNITTITIPESVVELENSVFSNSLNLTEIICYPTVAPALSTNSLSNMSLTGVLKYPAGSDYSNWLYYLGAGWVGQEF